MRRQKTVFFLGYGHDDFGYRLWGPKNKKLLRSRDVFFEELLLRTF